MTSRSLAIVALAALSVSACTHAPPQDHPGSGRGQGPPEGSDLPGPPWLRQQLFISPAGEPFRAQEPAPYPVAAWFAAADLNHDAALSRQEFVSDAIRFFASLDANVDGVVDGFEVSTYETKIAPEILLGSAFQVGQGSRGGGPQRGRGRMDRGPMGGGMQGAAPYALLAEPQPVMGADDDFNRRISREEATKAARSRFVLLDLDADQLLRVEELPRTPVQGAKPLRGLPDARRRPGSPR